jgi:hypothetical protein
VRIAAQGLGDGPLQLFAPAQTVEMRKRGWGSEEFEASNPESGVPLYYYLEEGFEGAVGIDILDSRGELVRSYSSEESEFERCLTHNVDPRSPYEPKYPSAKAGLNKWNWDTKRQSFTCVRDMTLFEGLGGPGVAPGDYIARLSAGDETREVSFTLVMDPRITSTAEEISAWTARLDETSFLLEAALNNLGNLRKARKQIKTLMDNYPEDGSLQQSGQSALEAIDAWDHELIQPLHQTYEDEDAWETMLAGQIRYLLEVIDSTGAPVTEGALLRLVDLKSEWAALEKQLDGIRSNHIDPINEWARQNSVPHVSGD